MEANLIRNGYNIERRKMYLLNQRHNLRSSIDFIWEQSLADSSNILARKRQDSCQMTRQEYTRKIQKKMEDQLKMEKSSFRVMPALTSLSPPSSTDQHKKYFDSLNRQIRVREEGRKKNVAETPFKKIPQNGSNSLSNSVFGYNLSEAYNKQSYLSKIFSDRLSPYLSKSKQKISSFQKHQSFTINRPVSLQYGSPR